MGNCNSGQASQTDPWNLAAKGQASQLQRWLDLGGHPSAVDRQSGRGTLLHAAAQHDQVECVKVLVRAGAQVNTVVKQHGSPLHVAAAHRTGRSVKMLLDCGANPLLKNAEGLTPLDVAASRGHRAAAALMQAAAAKPQASGGSGSTPKAGTIRAWPEQPAAAADHGKQHAAAAPAPAVPALPSQRQQLAPATAVVAATAKHAATAVPGRGTATPPAAAVPVAQAPTKPADAREGRKSWRESPKHSAASIGGAFGYPEWDARLATNLHAGGDGPRRLVGLPSELATLLVEASAAKQPPPPHQQQQQPPHQQWRPSSSGGSPPPERLHHAPATVPEDAALPDGMDTFSEDLTSYLEDLGYPRPELNSTLAACGDDSLATLGAFQSVLGTTSPARPAQHQPGTSGGPAPALGRISPRQRLMQQQQQQQPDLGRISPRQRLMQQQQQQQQVQPQQPPSTALDRVSPPQQQPPQPPQHRAAAAAAAAQPAATPQAPAHAKPPPSGSQAAAGARVAVPTPALADAAAHSPRQQRSSFSDDFLERVRAATARRNSDAAARMGAQQAKHEPPLAHPQTQQHYHHRWEPASSAANGNQHVEAAPLRGR